MRQSRSIIGGMLACVAAVLGSGSFVASRWRCNDMDCELTLAVANRDYDGAGRLLQRGADPNTDVYRFASDVACSKQFLVWNGSDDRQPALLNALKPVRVKGDIGDTEMARLLLEMGASPNATDEDGNTPLIIASRYGNVEIVRLLLSKHANKTLVNNRGITALQAAQQNRHPDIASLLRP